MSRFFDINQEKPTTVTWVIWAIIVVSALMFKLQYHELWRDEWQAWLVARDMNWSDMLGFLYYEGHPALWYLYLKPWTNVFGLGAEEMGLKIAHWVMWAAGIWVIFFRTRFSVPLAAAISLGYFAFFEYGMVSRGYALVLLLSMWAVSCFSEKNSTNNVILTKNALYLGGILLLLCQTEAQGVLIAACLGLYFFMSEKKWPWSDAASRGVSLGLVLGFLLFLVTVWPQGHAEELATARNSGMEWAAAFQGLFVNTYLPGLLQDTRAGGVQPWGLLLSALVFGALMYFFQKNRPLLATFLVGGLLFYGFAAGLFLGGIRQWGNFYLLFTALLALKFTTAFTWNLPKSLILALILVVQVSYTFRALWKDFQLPFSNAKECGLFLAEKVPPNVPVVGIDPFKTAGVGAYSERALYKMPEGEPFTYFHWLRKVYVPQQPELLLFAQFNKVQGIILVSPEPLPAARYPNAELWRSFDKEDLKGERFWVYALKKH